MSEEQWAVVELFGHVKMAGKVTEVERFGVKLGRIDIPNGDDFTTEFFGGGSIYKIRPVSEEVARAVAQHNVPQPIHPWEMPRPQLPAPTEADFQDTCDDDDDEVRDPF